MPTTIHIVVVAGATQKVLSRLVPALKEQKFVVVMREVKAKQLILDYHCMDMLIAQTADTVRLQAKKTEVIRLSFWYYDFGEQYDWVGKIQKLFFPFAYQVRIPHKYYNQDIQTTNFVLNHIIRVEQWIEFVTRVVTSGRSSTPFMLPMKNFQSDILVPLAWALLDTVPAEQLYGWLGDRRDQFRKEHRWRRTGRDHRPCFHDIRDYAFRQSDPRSGHGRTWPDNNKYCFLNGMLRFGASLVQGFHFDVQPSRDKVEGEFVGCDGNRQDLTSKRFT